MGIRTIADGSSNTQRFQYVERATNSGDAVNENLPDQKKLSGYSPKIMADLYIDDKALQFGDETSRLNSILALEKLINEYIHRFIYIIYP